MTTLDEMEALEKSCTEGPWSLFDLGIEINHGKLCPNLIFALEARDFVPYAIKRIRYLESIKEVYEHLKEVEKEIERKKNAD